MFEQFTSQRTDSFLQVGGLEERRNSVYEMLKPCNHVKEESFAFGSSFDKGGIRTFDMVHAVAGSTVLVEPVVFSLFGRYFEQYQKIEFDTESGGKVRMAFPAYFVPENRIGYATFWPPQLM